MILTTEQAVKALHIERHQLGQLRRFGLIHACRLGKGYGYRVTELERFAEWAQDKDLSSREKIKHWAKQKASETW